MITSAKVITNGTDRCTGNVGPKTHSCGSLKTNMKFLADLEVYSYHSFLHIDLIGNWIRGTWFQRYNYYVDPVGNWIEPLGAKPDRSNPFPPNQVRVLIPQRDRARYLSVGSLMPDVYCFKF